MWFPTQVSRSAACLRVNSMARSATSDSIVRGEGTPYSDANLIIIPMENLKRCNLKLWSQSARTACTHIRGPTSGSRLNPQRAKKLCAMRKRSRIGERSDRSTPEFYSSRVNLTRGSLAALSAVGISQKFFGVSSFIS